jgi:predicted nucleotide-binding protein
MSELAPDSPLDRSSYVCVARQSNVQAGEALYSFLQELGLQIITREMAAIWTRDGSPFALETMKEIFRGTQAVVILFSEDERVRLSRSLKKSNSENKFVSRPSLDLVFEAGYAFGCFPGNVILLRTKRVSLFSDIDGRYIAEFSETKAERLNLIRRLRTVGCTLTITTGALRISSGIEASDLLALADIDPLTHHDNERDNNGDLVVNHKKIFVIYGRNKRIKDAVFIFLRAIGLLPMEWEEAVHAISGAPYIGQVLDVLVRQAQAALVLLTGDDEVKQRKRKTGQNDQTAFQPRPNVVFEAGMAFGNSWLEKRTVLLEVGEVKICHALEGHHRFSHRNDTRHYWNLIEHLQRRGCGVEIEDEGLARRSWINIREYY